MYGQCREPKTTSNGRPCATRSRVTASPVDTSGSANGGASVPSGIISDCSAIACVVAQEHAPSARHAMTTCELSARARMTTVSRHASQVAEWRRKAPEALVVCCRHRTWAEGRAVIGDTHSGERRSMSSAQAISWDDAKSRTISRSITWNDRKSRRAGAALIVSLGLIMWSGVVGAALHRAPAVTVIVRAQAGQSAATAQAVSAAGGSVTRRIGLIDGLVARVPGDAVAGLARNAAVAELSLDHSLQLLGSSYDPTSDPDSLYNVATMDGAHSYWNAGYTGQGVDVALIDSGVAPVNGLTAAGKVVNGPDLSFESQNSSLRYLDTFGHGTHMAGIIAGRDDAVSSVSSSDSSDFMGMAPGARIVSLKVADAHGQTDVSQMLAAIDWVVQHKSDNGFNIRVLNLSFGTDSTQSYQLDPLAYAAEQAWKHGIVVVVSAGNAGNSSNGLDDPAIDPYVIAVAAADTNNTTNNVGAHTPASFTSEGDGTRNPDLSAPGVHVASLRVPGSYIDTQYGGSGTVGTRF